MRLSAKSILTIAVIAVVTMAVINRIPQARSIVQG